MTQGRTGKLILHHGHNRADTIGLRRDDFIDKSATFLRNSGNKGLLTDI